MEVRNVETVELTCKGRGLRVVGGVMEISFGEDGEKLALKLRLPPKLPALVMRLCLFDARQSLVSGASSAEPRASPKPGVTAESSPLPLANDFAPAPPLPLLFFPWGSSPANATFLCPL